MTKQGLEAIERAAAHENCACVPDRIHALIGGALFDFVGHLTSRDERITLSAYDWARPAVDALGEWAEKRGLCLNVADVADWHQSLAAAPAAPTEGARDAGAISADALASAMHDAAICYANGHTTDFQDIAREFLLKYAREASAQQDEREAFETAYAHLDLTKQIDSWHGLIYKHSHVDAMWEAWQRAASAHPDPLLAECVEVLESLGYHVRHLGTVAENERYDAILAKVQAAKEGK